MSSSLSIRSGTLFGSLSGRGITCQFRPVQAGDEPLPGEYLLQAPTHDPIYGEVALLVPSGMLGGGAVGAAAQSAKLSAKVDYAQKAGGPVAIVKVAPPAGQKQGGKQLPAAAGKYAGEYLMAAKVGMTSAKHASPSAKFDAARESTDKVAFEKMSGQSSHEVTFVLSSRPIPGRHSLVVSYGFSDLIEALTAAGGAHLTVR